MNTQEAILHELKVIRKLLVMKSNTVFYCEACEELKANGLTVKSGKLLCPDCRTEVKL